MFVIHKPIVDLRKEPEEICVKDYSHNKLRLTQLLFGEPLLLLKKMGEYLYVESVLQEHHTHDEGWHGYRGFIHKSDALFVKEYHPPTHVVSTSWTAIGGKITSFGTYLALDQNGQALLPDGSKTNVTPAHLRPLHTPFCRERIFQDARHFLNAPYLWGGCSAHGKEHVGSVDCSGLVYLLYRAQGILIPRDAHPQLLKGHQISKEELQKGDLIYLSPESNPSRASHVLLYKDKHTYMESPQTGEKVSEHRFNAKYKEEGPLVTIQGRKERYFPTYLSFTN
jgi:cell wall-associated NlpC family hydrolase